MHTHTHIYIYLRTKASSKPWVTWTDKIRLFSLWVSFLFQWSIIHKLINPKPIFPAPLTNVMFTNPNHILHLTAYTFVYNPKLSYPNPVVLYTITKHTTHIHTKLTQIFLKLLTHNNRTTDC